MIEKKIEKLEKFANIFSITALMVALLDTQLLNFLLGFTGIQSKLPVNEFYSNAVWGLFLAFILISIALRLSELHLRDKVYTKVH